MEHVLLDELIGNSPPFMKPEVSSPSSKEPFTGLYPEPDETGQHTVTPYLFKICFNIVLTFSPMSP
jgi:hypothetical protein